MHWTTFWRYTLKLSKSKESSFITSSKLDLSICFCFWSMRSTIADTGFPGSALSLTWPWLSRIVFKPQLHYFDTFQQINVIKPTLNFSAWKLGLSLTVYFWSFTDTALESSAKAVGSASRIRVIHLRFKPILYICEILWGCKTTLVNDWQSKKLRLNKIFHFRGHDANVILEAHGQTTSHERGSCCVRMMLTVMYLDCTLKKPSNIAQGEFHPQLWWVAFYPAWKFDPIWHSSTGPTGTKHPCSLLPNALPKVRF